MEMDFPVYRYNGSDFQCIYVYLVRYTANIVKYDCQICIGVVYDQFPAGDWKRVFEF